MKVDLNKKELNKLKEYVLDQMFLYNHPKSPFIKQNKKAFRFWENIYDKLRGKTKNDN